MQTRTDFVSSHLISDFFVLLIVVNFDSASGISYRSPVCKFFFKKRTRIFPAQLFAFFHLIFISRFESRKWLLANSLTTVKTSESEWSSCTTSKFHTWSHRVFQVPRLFAGLKYLAEMSIYENSAVMDFGGFNAIGSKPSRPIIVPASLKVCRIHNEKRGGSLADK